MLGRGGPRRARRSAGQPTLARRRHENRRTAGSPRLRHAGLGRVGSVAAARPAGATETRRSPHVQPARRHRHRSGPRHRRRHRPAARPRRVRRRRCSTSTRRPARPWPVGSATPAGRAVGVGVDVTDARPGRGRCRAGRRRARPAGRARQQRRHHPRQPHLQDDRGRLGRRDERAPQGRVPHDQGLPGAHDDREATAASSTSRRRRPRATAARPTTPPPRPGLQGFTKTLAIELGKFGVTANAVAPGFIQTDMTRGDRRAPRRVVRGLHRALRASRSPSRGSASPRTSPRRSPSSCRRRPASSPAR